MIRGLGGIARVWIGEHDVDAVRERYHSILVPTEVLRERSGDQVLPRDVRGLTVFEEDTYPLWAWYSSEEYAQVR